MVKKASYQRHLCAESDYCPPRRLRGFLRSRQYVRQCYTMAKFAPEYPLPRSADEFERLCLKLLRRHWQLPQLERFRDPKRAEKGINLIEISGRPRLAAVKCELSASRNDLTLAEIRSEEHTLNSSHLGISYAV